MLYYIHIHTHTHIYFILNKDLALPSHLRYMTTSEEEEKEYSNPLIEKSQELKTSRRYIWQTKKQRIFKNPFSTYPAGINS